MAHATAVGGCTGCPRSMQDRLRPGRAADLADDQRQQQPAQGVQDDPGGDLAAGESSSVGSAGRQVELAVLDQPVGAAGVHRQPRLHLETPGLQLDIEEPAAGGRHVDLPGVAAVAGHGQGAGDDLSRASCQQASWWQRRAVVGAVGGDGARAMPVGGAGQGEGAMGRPWPGSWAWAGEGDSATATATRISSSAAPWTRDDHLTWAASTTRNTASVGTATRATAPVSTLASPAALATSRTSATPAAPPAERAAAVRQGRSTAASPKIARGRSGVERPRPTSPIMIATRT